MNKALVAVVPRDKVAAVSGDDGRLYRLPPEILEAGTALVSGLIHPGTSGFVVQGGLDSWTRPEQIALLEDFAARAAVEETVARCRVLRAEELEQLRECERRARELGSLDEAIAEVTEALRVNWERRDALVDELLAPERRRLHGEMINAMDRVCEVIECRRRGSIASFVGTVEWEMRREKLASLRRAAAEQDQQEDQRIRRANEDDQAARRRSLEDHNAACRRLALAIARRGRRCPHCGRHSRDYEFVDRSPEAKSIFVCRSCARSIHDFEERP
jgi:hypothetical protein